MFLDDIIIVLLLSLRYTGPAMFFKPFTCIINSAYLCRAFSVRETGPATSFGPDTFDGTTLKAWLGLSYKYTGWNMS